MAGTQFKYDCPNCRARGAAFQVRYQWQHRDTMKLANLLAVCGICNDGIIVHVGTVHTQLQNMIQNTVSFPSDAVFIISVIPSDISDLPDGVPDNTLRFYTQGLKNLQDGQWDASGAMFRKSLDTSTKILSPDNKDLTLYKRINKLVDDGHLTEAMGDWSHEIRLDGNAAVHDDEPESEEDARRIQKFTEAFLIYAFSLPTLVATSREGRVGG